MTSVSELIDEMDKFSYNLSSVCDVFFGGFVVRKRMLENLQRRLPTIQRLHQGTCPAIVFIIQLYACKYKLHFVIRYICSDDVILVDQFTLSGRPRYLFVTQHIVNKIKRSH